MATTEDLNVIAFTGPEQEFMFDLVTWWLEGMDEATTDVANDRSIEEVETYLDAMAGMVEQKEVALAIRTKLDKATA